MPYVRMGGCCTELCQMARFPAERPDAMLRPSDKKP